jgi:hypothetical protein
MEYRWLRRQRVSPVAHVSGEHAVRAPPSAPWRTCSILIALAAAGVPRGTVGVRRDCGAVAQTIARGSAMSAATTPLAATAFSTLLRTAEAGLAVPSCRGTNAFDNDAPPRCHPFVDDLRDPSCLHCRRRGTGRVRTGPSRLRTPTLSFDGSPGRFSGWVVQCCQPLRVRNDRTDHAPREGGKQANLV